MDAILQIEAKFAFHLFVARLNFCSQIVFLVIYSPYDRKHGSNNYICKKEILQVSRFILNNLYDYQS